jgi:hypothetical protein
MSAAGVDDQPIVNSQVRSKLSAMKTIILLFALAGVTAFAVTPAGAAERSAPVVRSPDLDSGKMEKDLQRLPWKQFRTVVESEPRLKAGIEAYGPIGWQFVEANYRNYGWKRNIDKLDASQKKRLAEQIRRVSGRAGAN